MLCGVFQREIKFKKLEAYFKMIYFVVFVTKASHAIPTSFNFSTTAKYTFNKTYSITSP